MKSKAELAEESAAFLRESPTPRAVTSVFAGYHHNVDEDQYHDRQHESSDQDRMIILINYDNLKCECNSGGNVHGSRPPCLLCLIVVGPLQPVSGYCNKIL